MDLSSLQLFDMDHVLLPDGKIYRVLGNFESTDRFLGYNLYSPASNGDRLFRGQPYVKNYIEEAILPEDVLETYDIVEKKDIVEYFDPIAAAQVKSNSFRGTIWFDLYEELVELFGKEAIGMFGSALPGLHLNKAGTIKNDVDFFIEGLENVPKLAAHLHEVREELGFTDYDPSTQEEICKGWRKVFRNEHNTFERIIDRRWSGMQLTTDSSKVLNTFRFRDKSVTALLGLIDTANIAVKNVQLSGTVTDDRGGNLYPRTFTIVTDNGMCDIYSMWWKFSSPVSKGDNVIVRGNIVDGQKHQTLILTNYIDHFIKIN
jgi:predicted nucleotidyltransferase